MLEIIDSHVHVTENRKWMNSNMDSSLKRLLTEMKIANVKKAILIGIDGLVSNDYISKIRFENIKKFYCFCSINPLKTTFEEFIDLVKVGKYLGVKIHPRLQNFSLSDEKIKTFFKKVETIPNFLVMLDCWFSEDQNINDIENSLNFVNLFEKLTIILAHAGGFHYDSIIPLALKQNVFLDLSYTPIILKKYKEDKFVDFFSELKKVDTSKLIFGSDFPERSIMESVDILKRYLDKYDFSIEEQKNVFSRNIEMLIDKQNGAD